MIVTRCDVTSQYLSSKSAGKLTSPSPSPNQISASTSSTSSGAPAVWQAALESSAAELVTAMDPWITVEHCNAEARDALRLGDHRGGRRWNSFKGHVFIDVIVWAEILEYGKYMGKAMLCTVYIYIYDIRMNMCS